MFLGSLHIPTLIIISTFRNAYGQFCNDCNEADICNVDCYCAEGKYQNPYLKLINIFIEMTMILGMVYQK